MFKEEADVKVVENLRRSLEESSEEESQRPSMETTLTGEPIEVPAAKKKTKKEPRPKTAYTFAHTAARVNALHKLKSRPPAVLQLQKVTADARPKPAFEVFPSGRYAKKLGRNLSRLHKGKDKLGADDVVLCKAHEYDAHEDDWESQEVVGIVCASCKDESHASGNAQLCLEDGSTWQAIPHPKGRYDFVSIDEHGVNRVVRWVPRRVRSKPKPLSTPTSPVACVSPTEEVVYRFSTIDPRTRRHPVIATMTQTDLEISDTYYMPRSTSQADEADENDGSATVTPYQEDEPVLDSNSSERELVHTAPLLRSLILLSGIYIALRNNWSPVFTYKKDACHVTDVKKIASCNNSVRSTNTSPTPSADRVPFGTTRRHTFNFHRRSSTVATTSGTSMSTALSGGFGDHSNTETSLPSRSTTPESRRRRTDTLLTGLMRSATDRFADKGRQPSNTTESGDSTAAEGSEYSLPDGLRTPTPSGRLGSHDAGFEDPGSVRRASTMSGGFLPRKSSLRKHWRMPSNPKNNPEFVSPTGSNDFSDMLSSPMTSPANEDGITPAQSRRFSFSRGRARQRPEKTLSMIDSRPPPAYHNQQWWMNWGADQQPASRPPSVVLDESRLSVPAAQQQIKSSSPARLSTEQKPSRPSFSIGSWRRKDSMDRPRSVFLTSGFARDKSPLSGGRDKSPLSGGEGSALRPVALGAVQKRDNAGFSGLMQRVTRHLRREERKIG